ncbi:MAG TPA: Hsp20/alpha crystallin family protein [Anaerolineales bacterium]|nr:Hsp20/alpha crystallin family protein [Anaerolineales bacterium]
MPGRIAATNIRVILRTAEGGEWTAEAERVPTWAQRRAPHLWRPPTDIYEAGDELVVVVEVAGMQEAEVSVTIGRQTLTITGSRPGHAGPRAYHQMEIAHGDFVAEVALPVAVDPAGVQANYSDGFLTVTLPKVKPKRVSVSG